MRAVRRTLREVSIYDICANPGGQQETLTTSGTRSRSTHWLADRRRRVLAKYLYRGAKIAYRGPVAAIHPPIGNLEQWPQWSPWKDGALSLFVTIPGQKAGAGAHQTWVGDQRKGGVDLDRERPR